MLLLGWPNRHDGDQQQSGPGQGLPPVLEQQLAEMGEGHDARLTNLAII